MSVLGLSVLGRVFPQDRYAMDYVLSRLTSQHFSDVVERSLFSLLESYGHKYGEVFPGSYLVDLLSRNSVKSSQSILYTEAYNLYCAQEVTEAQFRYSVDALCDDRNREMTGEALTTAMQILQQPVEVDGEVVSGWRDSLQYLSTQLADIDALSLDETAPTGDIRLEGQKILAEYETLETLETPPGVQFGLGPLDEVTSGMQNGELILLAAFTNSGKSMLAAQLSWNACVHQGKPVFFATTETVRGTTIRRILARHSREPQFGYPRGLDISKIKNGRLTPDEKAVFHDVVRDFTENSNYAPFHISQLPRDANLRFIENQASRANRQGPPLELLLIDSLQLLKSERSRVSEREEFNELLRSSKVAAVSFDKGRGVPIVSPWQMREPAYEAAVKALRYTLKSLSDTSEAERSADLVISLLRPTPNSDEALIQILKARDSALLDPSPVHLDYHCAYIGETSVASLGDSPSGFGNLDLDSRLNGS